MRHTLITHLYHQNWRQRFSDAQNPVYRRSVYGFLAALLFYIYLCAGVGRQFHDGQPRDRGFSVPCGGMRAGRWGGFSPQGTLPVTREGLVCFFLLLHSEIIVIRTTPPLYT